MLDVNLRRIVPKAAGTYFIVRDNSQVEEIEEESKMRLFFINVEQGPINMAITFAKGDTAGFTSVFGRGNRMMKKKGNFSIDTCLDALEAGPITVVNLRAFDDSQDTCSVTGMNPNSKKINGLLTKSTPYTNLFNTNTFWSPNYSKMNDVVENCVLNFANVGNVPFSIFVTISQNVDNVTSEGDKSLMNCSMEIDEYPALDFNTPVKDTIVDVYLFNTKFNPETVSTNKYYGHLFDSNGNLPFDNLDELCNIKEAGFVRLFTGSIIPNLVNEQGDEISINTVINSYFMETGLICDINDDMFEKTSTDAFIDTVGYSFFDTTTGERKDSAAEQMLSHIVPVKLTIDTDGCDIASQAGYINVEKIVTDEKSFYTNYGSGIRYGNTLLGKDRIVNVISLEMVDDGVLEDSSKIKVTCDGVVEFFKNSEGGSTEGGSTEGGSTEGGSTEGGSTEGGSTEEDNQPAAQLETQDFKGNAQVLKYNNIFTTSMLKPTILTAYSPRSDQFLDGTSSRQKEILDMMINPGIVKGLCGISGLRYVVDCFKSFVESGYKSQFGQLMNTLDEKNRFVRAIINEPFVEDLQKSTNPMFKQTPSSTFDFSYLPDGGNKNFSTKLLTKFSVGDEFCFFYGPGEKINNITVGLAGKISNLFYLKENAWDVIANTTGVIDGIQEIEYPLDDDDRKYCEKFRWNPVINLRGANRIYGNLSGKADRTAQQQVTNSELLAYIKENLYNMSTSEIFKRGTYDYYLRIDTQGKEFMNALVMAGVIDADFVCECSASNNTIDIRKQRLAVVHVEYTPVDVIEKVVFDITIN